VFLQMCCLNESNVSVLVVFFCRVVCVVATTLDQTREVIALCSILFRFSESTIHEIDLARSRCQFSIID
jgi:hypothetical protein